MTENWRCGLPRVPSIALLILQGVWRIPQNEIDRPGSFAAHMSRSVVLLLDVLAEVKDYKMLIDLSIQLKVEPEAEKWVALHLEVANCAAK